MANRIESGRAAFARGAWAEAYAALARVEALDQDDLEALAVAACLVGEVRASELAWEQAQRLAASRGEPDRAARCAFWLGFDLLLRGEASRASGWLSRAERLASGSPDGPATGFLLLAPFMGALDARRLDDALDLARQIDALGHATGDADLLAFGLLCRGETLIAQGDALAGTRCLDEVMVSITTGEVSPLATGIVYCAVIAACMRAQDLRRAADWTEAFSEWCATESSLVPFRGVCMVHRSQVLMARGAWEQAREEAEHACTHLERIAHPALGVALYQEGEVHRLRGDLAAAEAAYRAASRHGVEPVPGLGLLRLAQGRTSTAAASARRMLDETRSHPERPTILAAVVEILVAASALDEADTACDELDALAATGTADLVSALASTARGSLLLAGGDAASAAPRLRTAVGAWRRLDMPYEEARARASMAQACALLGDDDGAELELEAARATFDRLGARTEQARLEGRPSTPLTARECEVVRLVADGRTNREIAAVLAISEHTVSRHLQNIFTKLRVTSRAAATAYAYEHGIV